MGNNTCCLNLMGKSKGLETSHSSPLGNSSLLLIPKDKASVNSLKIGPNIFVSLKEGAITDYYDLGEEIGEGAYGKVTKVTHKKTGMQRVLKTIMKKKIPQDEEETLFMEVCVLKRIDHPNIAKLYELFQDADRYMLIFEYCRGGELFDRIQSFKCFSEKQAAEYMKQLLSAVAYCHSNNIVHRDLKPENLLLDSTDLTANLKVIDFGTSRWFEKGKQMKNEYGTCYYIAPEVLGRNYDEKCDIWSCGVIMYVMLCGYPPFNGSNDDAIMKTVKKGVFHFPQKEWKEVSEAAKNLIRKMLTVDPKKRISAQEAINTAWVQRNSRSNPICDDAMKNLSEFRSKNKLYQAILTFIANEITTQQEKEELQLTFQQLDTDGSGTLSANELIEGYTRVYKNRKRAEYEVKQILAQTDMNFSGEIEFTEFILAAMERNKLLSKQKIEQAFKLFDLNDDGYISREELAKVMGGIDLPEVEWTQLIREFDSKQDSKISLEDFISFLTARRKSVSGSVNEGQFKVERSKPPRQLTK